eukprot:320520_1
MNVMPKKCKMCENVRIIKVPVERDGFQIKESFSIPVPYSSSIQIQHLMNQIEQYTNEKLYPKIYQVVSIRYRSFIEEVVVKQRKDEWNQICSKPITAYNISDIIKKGLLVTMQNKVEHFVNRNSITCKYMLNDVKNDVDEHKKHDNKLYEPLNCPVYKSMKIDYKFTENNLNHLNEFVHFTDEFHEKP